LSAFNKSRNKSKALSKQPCINPECGSSDGRQVYEDNTSFCFSCNKFFPAIQGDFTKAKTRTEEVQKYEGKKSIAGIQNLGSRFLKDRKISLQVCEFFGIKVSVDNLTGEITTHYYPYENENAYKVREVANKRFSWIGHSKDLFGRDKFNGGGKRVIIVEGELDVGAVAQASQDKYGKIYPVVGLSSGVMLESIIENREWLRSFEEIVLFFDQDKVGQKALKEALKILGNDKCKIVKTSYKDANEVLMLTNDSKNIMNLIYEAAPYIPSGMIKKEEIWAAIVSSQNQVVIPYPPCVQGLNTKLKGMKGGEITLFISGTGSGKTTLMKETSLHLIAFQPQLQVIIDTVNSKLEPEQEEVHTFKIKVGVVSLEEPPHETGKKFAAMALCKNLGEEEIPLSELRRGFDMVFDDEAIMLLDHQGSMNDTSIIEKLEYMILMGCTHLFIDHITILVSEGAEGLTGNEAQDKVMNDLLKLVTKYPHVWIGLVSHLRKTQNNKPFEAGNMPTIDDIKGSGSIKQISFDIVAFCRDMTAEDEDQRNTIEMAILKCRRTGLTGTVPGSKYDHKTGRLLYLKDAVNQEAFSLRDTKTVRVEEVAKVERKKPNPIITNKSPIAPGNIVITPKAAPKGF
jgi:twinkle protein